jgi:hypothetical protein
MLHVFATPIVCSESSAGQTSPPPAPRAFQEFRQTEIGKTPGSILTATDIARFLSRLAGPSETSMLPRRLPKFDRIKWRWTRRRALLAGAIVSLLFVLVMLLLLLHGPSWYAPPTIAPGERQHVRNNLIAAEQAFTESLRADVGTFVYHIYQDDVNRWLAMRREIYPLLDELAPPELADPFVLFDSGQITLAGRYRSGALDAVVSVDIAVAMQGDRLNLTVAAARLGLVRMPLGIAHHLGLDKSVDRGPDDIWPGSPRIWGDLTGGLNVGSDAWWKNGGVAYRVLDVSVERGAINVTVEPRGHHEVRKGTDRKQYSSPAEETDSRANRPANR